MAGTGRAFGRPGRGDQRSGQVFRPAGSPRPAELRDAHRDAGRPEPRRALLPTALPEFDDVIFAARYLPSEASLNVGGDWYDVRRLPDGRLLVGVGDVVGRGLPAVGTMQRLRMAAAALAPSCSSVAELLSRLDARAAAVDGACFATTTYAMVDCERCTLEYAAAGHPPMLVVDPDGTTRFLDQGRSPPLVAAHGARAAATASIDPGATLILYSDGLVERRGEAIDQGLDRLAEAAAAAAYLDLDAMCDAIVGAVCGFGHGDDVVVLAMRLRLPANA